MKRFVFLTVLCCLVLGMRAQTAKEEIFADVHRSAANYYAYPEPTVEQTAPPAGYKPFYLSHYARHGSRFLINPDDYEKPLAVMREADENGVLTELGKKTLCVLDSVSRMAKSRYGELTPLGARQHKGIAERMYKNFPEVFKGEAEVDACSTVVIRCILSMAAECLKLQSLNPKFNRGQIGQESSSACGPRSSDECGRVQDSRGRCTEPRESQQRGQGSVRSNLHDVLSR